MKNRLHVMSDDLRPITEDLNHWLVATDIATVVEFERLLGKHAEFARRFPETDGDR